MKIANSLIISSLMLILLCSFVNASMSITPTHYDFSSTEKWQTVTLALKNTGTSTEIGIIELAVQQTANFQSLIGGQAACDYRTPYNVYKEYTIAAGGTATMTLTATGIKEGTYYPVLVHVNHCCTFDTSCEAKSPIGWGMKLTENPVTFGDANANSADQCDTDYEALQYVRKHGSENCAGAVCDAASSLTSTARCIKVGECAAGAVQPQVCNDGHTINIRYCNEGTWQDTGAACTGEAPDPEPSPISTGVAFYWILGIAGVALLVFVLRKTGVVRFK